MMLRVAIAALAALVLPNAAHAGLTAMRSQDVLAVSGATGSRLEPGRFDLVGLHWSGPGNVEFRTRSLSGRWSPWRPAAPEEEDGPDTDAAEARRSGWRLGSPWWTGPADALDVRTRGRVTRVRAWTVRSIASGVPPRRPAAATQPAIVSRASWGADESIRKGDPSYAPELRYAVVHHTAGTNGYTRAEAPAVVRAILRYHVQANGWNDIGYNFLVDRFGTVYEGRYGGIESNVVGAHAVGFNTGSVGVALLGTYTDTAPSAAAEKALEQLLAWRLDLAHVDPAAMLSVVSGGSPKFAAGLPVTLRAVSGHRDVGLTECPGAALYARLRALASVAAATGLPKLYEPSATAQAGSVVFHARLSTPLPWTVSVSDSQGTVVASGSGDGGDVDWTWDTTTVPPATYTWTIAAGTGPTAVTPATGVVTAGSATTELAVTDTEVQPDVVSPDGDGLDDLATVSYRLSTPAAVAVTAIDDAGVEVEVEPATWRRAGAHTAGFDAVSLPDGLYTVELSARSAAGSEATATVAVVVTRTLNKLTLSPLLFSPNGDGRADTLRIAFTLTRPAAVRAIVLRDGAAVTTVLAGPLAAGRHVVRFDGRKRAGPIADGAFTVAVEADDGTATAHAELPFASDTTPPRLRLVSRTPARIAVSEPVNVRLTVNGVMRRLRVAAPATVTIPGIRTLDTLHAVAWDRAGNTGALRVKRARPPAK